MRVLISNDDGYLAPGLEVLVQAITPIATEILVVAPEQDKSGASSSLTLDRPLSVYTAHNGYRFVNGTPTDCVHIALTSLFADRLPDLVLSGINRGANMGDDTIYSGTVAAAIEGHLFDIPAFAFSLVSKSRENLPTAQKVVKDVVAWYWQTRDQWRPSCAPLFNVNIPDCAINELKGWSVTRLGKRHKAEPVIPAKNLHGDTVYWIGPAGAAQDAGEGSDFYAVEHQSVSITPLSVDLTNHASLAPLQSLALMLP